MSISSTTTGASVRPVSSTQSQWVPPTWFYVVVGIGSGIFLLLFLGVAIVLLILKYTSGMTTSGRVHRISASASVYAG